MVPNRPTWTVESVTESPAVCMRIKVADGYLSFAKVFDLLVDSRRFRSWYSEQLAACHSDAIYWEHPCLTDRSASLPYEAALIDAPALATIQPDSRAFESQFATCPGLDVTAFKNLGGDATLIVPTPVTPNADYSHLLSFLRTANERQIDAFWQCAAAILRENLSQRPAWLSTAGGGVDWLHVRIDSSPKYYRHSRYRRSA